jgi:hypothetical protein
LEVLGACIGGLHRYHSEEQHDQPARIYIGAIELSTKKLDSVYCAMVAGFDH